jgi:predicted dehydrogenase
MLSGTSASSLVIEQLLEPTMDKVRLGIIGTSYWAEGFYLHNLHTHPHTILAAICGRNQTRAEELAAKFGVGQAYSDYRRMIDGRSLDAVVVATPEDLHHPMTMAALEAGLHVICEKPLAQTAAQAQEMYQTAEAKKVKHMNMLTMRWLPHFRHLKRLVDDGYIGQPYHAHFDFLTGWSPEPGEYSWAYDSARAHGAASELGAHLIDLARWYLGEVARVKASLASFIQRPGLNQEVAYQENDSAMLILEMANGAQVSLHVSAANRAGEGLRHTGQMILLHGREGTLETRGGAFAPPPDSDIVGLRRGAERAEILEIPDEFKGSPKVDSAFQVFEQNWAGPRQFIEAILNDRSISPNFHDGYKAQQVIEAALESQRTQRTVEIDHTLG